MIQGPASRVHPASPVAPGSIGPAWPVFVVLKTQSVKQRQHNVRFTDASSLISVQTPNMSQAQARSTWRNGPGPTGIGWRPAAEPRLSGASRAFGLR